MEGKLGGIRPIESESEPPETPLEFPEFTQPNKDDEWFKDSKAWRKDIIIPG